MRRRIPCRPNSLALATCALLGAVAPALAQPVAFESRGAGGGGALFSPAISPHDPAVVSLACDLTVFLRSPDFGRTWNLLDSRSIQGNNGAEIHYTEDPLVLYSVDFTGDLRTPVKSTDGGATWFPLPGDPTFAEAWSLQVDPLAGERVLVGDYNALHFSTDGGATFAMVYEDATGGGAHVAGAFFDGATIFVGTNAGLLVSPNGGATFALDSTPGIPADEAMVSFAGSRLGTTFRLYCVTLGSGDVYAGITGAEHFSYRGIYVVGGGLGSWTRRVSGVAASDHPFFVSTSRGAPDVAWIAGGSDAGVPVVHRTTDAGLNWTPVLDTIDNGNVVTGWSGDGGDRNWGYGEYALGFKVAPTDPNRAVFTDLGFAHGTTDGGATWRQMYVDPEDENPAGADTPRRRHYRGNGLENTSYWSLLWTSPTNMIASATDIRGTRSTDGGESWSFDYSGHTLNTMYRAALHPDGTVYAGTSSVHDMYQSTYLTDARIDGGSGLVLISTDEGATWTTMHDPGRPVVWVETDPTRPERLWAAVVHSSQGGIFFTDDRSAGAASTWTRTIANPPRTEGHPFNVVPLADGSLVCTFSGRRNSGGAFTQSSGVFLTSDDGATWSDRSAPGMIYWTKDLIVDPNDPAQNRWYAFVWSGFGGPPNGLGGVYRTTDRGLNWTRIDALDRVSSGTIDPRDGSRMYITTEIDGLWLTENLNDPAPEFARVESYPYRQPERVFFNPHDPAEVWVTSFGHALRVGREPPTDPLGFLLGTAPGAPTDDANADGAVDAADAVAFRAIP